jgi:uncharacterized protein (DUF885 family)
MAKLLLIIALALTILLGCSTPPTEDQQFERLANNYIETILRLNPEYATGLGDHRFDHLMNDYSIAAIERALSVNKSYLDSLASIDREALNPVNSVDYGILTNVIESSVFQAEEIREFEWNPMRYNIGNGIYNLIAREFAPLEERLRNVKSRLEAIPAILEVAKSNLGNPPRVHTETAISQNRGNINLIQNDLDLFLSEVPHMQDELAPARSQAVEALEDYGRWLQDELLPRSTGDFRIGEERFRKKLKFTLASDLSPEEILQRAETDLTATQNEMYDTALPLFRQYYPNMRDQRRLNDKKFVIQSVLNKLAEDRPTGETIVDQARRDLEETTAFVREQNLVSVPDEPIRIIVMPEFRRGIAIAYCDSPGPLEEGGETFYAISPPPADWDRQRVESLFKEYNDYMLKNLTVHEAMPGHYLQLAHSNRFSATTPVRSVFWSGPFVEGWATYAEQLMVEFGYGGPEVKMQQLKMRLRLIINAIIDQKIHAGNMTEQQAIDLMMKEGFQEEGEAVGKWRRACLTSTQLSTYYVGNIEVNDIRKAYEEKHGANTDLKEMHDTMLSFGSPPARYVRALMGI